jgi:hypothetical protein
MQRGDEELHVGSHIQLDLKRRVFGCKEEPRHVKRSYLIPHHNIIANPVPAVLSPHTCVM